MYKKAKNKIKGQISIFLVLVFMVIFVLFGMTVSMTMFVHDKINLQNATDLASYYVATKQAEMLSAIAHNNYQIRQSWKLLAYRYRVYANSSRTDPSASGVNIRHPGIQSNWSTFYGNDTIYQPADMFGGNRPPRVCVGSAHLFWDIVDDNPCRTINFSTPYIAPVASTLPILIGGINSGVTAANKKIQATCQAVAYINWWFANTIYGAHKLEQRDRRAVIRALAQNLAQPISPGGMKDLEGQSVFDGAQKTFLYNLSESNRRLLEASVDKQPTIRFLNPLQGRDPSDWLKEIYVNTVLPFSFFTTNGPQCAEDLMFHNDISTLPSILASPEADDLRSRLDPDNRIALVGIVENDPNGPLYNVTVGVEKNPWMLVYNKAEAKVFSRPLFLGEYFETDGIQMDAVAYSKPFGGRIGPWYNVQWPSGSDQSSGGGKTDPRLPPRVDLATYGTVADYNDETLYPNYSKYPGDEDGLTTYASMVMAGPTVGWNYSGLPATNPPPTTGTQDYYGAVYSYFGAEHNDPLAQDFDNTSEPWNSFNRRMEIAAIAPDAFDMTYYSISPGYYDYFIEDTNIGRPRLKNWLQAELPQFVELRGDLGSHNGGSGQRINYDIVDQLRVHDEVLAEDDGVYGFTVQRSREPVRWFNTNVDAFAALLTGWNKGPEPMAYESANSGALDSFFANCSTSIVDNTDKPKIPSECLKGGRFGYSVKLISKSYIDSEQNNGGTSPGSIINPL